MSMLDEWASSRTMEECEAILTEGSVPCSRYYTVREGRWRSASCGARQFEVNRRRRGAAQGAESGVQVWQLGGQGARLRARARRRQRAGAFGLSWGIPQIASPRYTRNRSFTTIEAALREGHANG